MTQVHCCVFFFLDQRRKYSTDEAKYATALHSTEKMLIKSFFKIFSTHTASLSQKSILETLYFTVHGSISGYNVRYGPIYWSDKGRVKL